MTLRRRALLVNVAHGAHGDGEDHPRHHVAPMDLALCAALLEDDGWDVDFWDTQTDPGTDPERLERLALAKAPDLLMVRAIHGTVPTASSLCSALASTTTLRLALGPASQPACRTLLGAEGTQPSPCTGVFVGEPEGTLIELLSRMNGGTGRLENLENLAAMATPGRPTVPARPFLSDLNALPLPAQHHLMAQGYRFRYPLDVRAPLRIGYSLTSRGCALGCVFCAPLERESYGTKYRYRSADSVCDELELLQSLGANAVYFIDDFFAFSNKRVAALCERIIERGLAMPWAAQVRAQGLPLELLQLMRRAGCSTLCFGAESGSDRLLKLLHKGVTTDQVRKQADLISRAGIQKVGYFIVGVPSETAEERAATYSLIEEIQPDVVQLHIFNVFEGAPAFDDPRFATHYDPASDKFTGPSSLRPELRDLDAERREFYRRYYLSPAYLGRQLRRRFWPLMANLEEELAFARRSARFFFAKNPGDGLGR